MTFPQTEAIVNGEIVNNVSAGDMTEVKKFVYDNELSGFDSKNVVQENSADNDKAADLDDIDI